MHTESFIYRRTEIEINVERIIWGIFDIFVVSEAFVSVEALITCFGYMLLTNTVLSSTKRNFSLYWRQEVEEALSDNCPRGPFASSIQKNLLLFLPDILVPNCIFKCSNGNYAKLISKEVLKPASF